MNSEEDAQIKFEFVPSPNIDANSNEKADLSKIPFPGCMKCKRLIVSRKVKGWINCEAYPERIPTEIMLGYVDHTKPYKND